MTQQVVQLTRRKFGETMRRVVAATEDATEGRTAVLERRDPVWRGR